MNNSFGTRGTIDSGGTRAGIYRLSKLAQNGVGNIDRLPFSIKVLLENALRNEDGRLFQAEDVVNLAPRGTRTTTGRSRFPSAQRG